MPKAISVVPGQRFGRLTVVREGDRKLSPGRPKGARTFWCRCDCGGEVNVMLSALTKTSGSTKSCGCLLIAKPVDVKPGDRFGRLVVECEMPRRASRTRPRGIRVFRCRCDCGEVRDVLLNNLRRDLTKSCGCLNQENRKSPENVARLTADARTKSITHGLRHHPLYTNWHNMMQRCYYEQGAEYHNYGGRGITVCPEWHDVAVFIAWIEANLGPRPGGVTAGGIAEYTIDRIEVNGSYEPGNIRWANWRTQALNKRRSA